MATRPDITTDDLIRMMNTSKDWQEEDPEVWMAKAGLTSRMLSIIGMTIVESIIERMHEGERLSEAIYQEGLTAMQLGWLIHKEFGERTA